MKRLIFRCGVNRARLLRNLTGLIRNKFFGYKKEMYCGKFFTVIGGGAKFLEIKRYLIENLK